VLLPAILFTQVARPIPRPTALESNGKEHRLEPYDC
jgi:hypothetical protein